MIDDLAAKTGVAVGVGDGQVDPTAPTGVSVIVGEIQENRQTKWVFAPQVRHEGLIRIRERACRLE